MKITKAAAVCAAAMACAASASAAGWEDSLSFGADLRIRQEMLDNVPGLPGGGLLLRAPRSSYRNHVRFRPRVWAGFEPDENWKLFLRLTDESRWNIRPRNHSNNFPDEAVIDNLFVEAKGLFDGLLDFKIGRQDIYNLYGLDHVFIDGTPGDGSRTVYSDMARAALDFDAAGKLDVFALYNWDRNPARWGTRKSSHRSLSGLGGGAEPDMDDWGWGAIWSANSFEWLDWQVFAMEKRTASYERRGVKRPSQRREMFGFKLVPKLDDEFSLQLEAMGQTGRNGDHESLSGWSAYAGVNWRKAASEDRSWSPFARLGFHAMSGDKDAADEDGGHSAWDPMWSRGVNDSEMFLYGSHYGAAWWSNQLYLKATAGVEFSKLHRATVSAGPLFAEQKDGMGGGDGAFKGFLSQAKYEFPILVARGEDGGGFEIVGHVLGELFNPGDYFSTDKPGWFLRWQVEFRF